MRKNWSIRCQEIIPINPSRVHRPHVSFPELGPGLVAFPMGAVLQKKQADFLVPHLSSFIIDKFI
jgi:hypothetical protein